MNFTLHLTANCNLACRYCYEKHSSAHMDEETLMAACGLLFSFGHKKNGFSFFGGEPLLCRGLIEKALYRCDALNLSLGGTLSYTMTTNGLLLDESFMELADSHNLEVALSHDGLLQDVQRVDAIGRGVSELLEPKIDLLLSHQPNALAMMTVLPENASLLADSVKWLYERGFSRINIAIDMRPNAAWDDSSMRELDLQLASVSEICERYYDSARPLKLLNFESKIAAFLEDRPCMECRLGVRQPSIAPDGRIYPCNQFLNDPEYLMGDVDHGIDAAAQKRIIELAARQEPTCEGCALEKRCRHHCACLNYSMTGDMHRVPAVQCEYERILIRNADKLAERLYKKESPRFMRAYGK